MGACLPNTGACRLIASASDVLREYCDSVFCWMGLENEDAVAPQHAMGMAWNGEMTSLEEIDSVAPGIGQSVLSGTDPQNVLQPSHH